MRCKKNQNILLMKFCVAIISSFMLAFSLYLSYTIINEEKIISDFSPSSSPTSKIKLMMDDTHFSQLKNQIKSIKEKNFKKVSIGSFPLLFTSSKFFNMSICGKNWTVYVFAFSLGAFWNVKHLKKIGIV